MFAEEIDTGRAAQTELRQELVHIVDAEIATDLIKIDITGLCDGVVQVYGSMAFGPPVTLAVLVSLQLEVAHANTLASQVGGTGFKRGQRQHWFDS